MSFTLHTSNLTENLLDHLSVVLSNPLSSPFAKEVFLIQSQGMERWLLQNLSNRFGVMANYDLLFPNKFFNQVAQSIDPKGTLKPSTFDRERLVWTVESVLRSVQTDDDFPEVKAYLSGAQAEAKRFQLAQQLTQLFDQYQVFRSDVLEQSNPTDWTLRIWQKVMQHLGYPPHIGQMWAGLIRSLNEVNPAQPIQGLPERISVFGIHSMPEVFLQVLQALAKHTDVHLYVTQPTEGYWGDLRSRAEIKRDKVKNIFVENKSELDLEANHPLLSLLGQQGRDFHHLLVEHAEFDLEFDSFENDDSTALSRLQGEIYANLQPSEKLKVEDDSIQIVSCHSRMREVQVLRDAILQALSENSELELRDIVVMAPNIADYEPYIQTIFSGGEPALAFAVADKSVKNANLHLDTLSALLAMLGGRFEWAEVMDLFERAPIQALLDLDERDVEQIQAWVANSHTRWGRDAEHRASLGLPELNQNTWDAGLRQMMMGFLMQGQAIEIEGSQAQLLAKVDGFVRRLFRWAQASKQARTPQEWSVWLNELVAQLFDVAHVEVAPLLNTLDILAQIELEENYPLSSIMAWLDETIGEHKTSQGFMAGQLTFCSMLPMRSIPFKMVAVLGLNEGEFPKQDRPPSFDLMGGKDGFRPGDRSARIDDRYQFLEIILAARERLYLSYIGQSQKKPQAIPPSVVLSELMDELNIEVIKHPLQSFSAQYFVDAENALHTYDAEAYKVAQSLTKKPLTAPKWVLNDDNLPAFEEKRIELQDLMTFAAEPQRWFVQNRLGLNLSDVEAELPAHELFEAKGLEKYQLDQAMFEALKHNRPATEIHAQMMAEGAWISGEMGALTLTKRLNQIEEMKTLIDGFETGEPSAEPYWVEAQIGDFRVEGALRGFYENGFVLARYAKFKPKDFIRAWLTHLLTGQTVWLVGLVEKNKKQFLAHHVLEGHDEPLKGWIEAYASAHSQPSAFWPQMAWDYLASFEKKPSGIKDKSEEVIEQMIQDKADKAAFNQFKKLTGQEEKAIPDKYVIKLTQGYEYNELWNDSAKALSLQLIAPLHQAVK